MIDRISIGVGVLFGSSRFNEITNRLGCSGGMAMGLGCIWVMGCGLGVMGFVAEVSTRLGCGGGLMVVAQWWVVVAWRL